MDTIDIAVIGAGANGLAAAYRLLEKHPDKTIAVFEKNKYFGEEQSGRNSGVDHTCYQYTHGTLKARLVQRPDSLLKQFCEKYDVPYARVGKLIVAKDNADALRLDAYYERGLANGVTIEKLTREGIKAIEPNVEGVAALYTPMTGVVDAATYVRTLERLVRAHDGMIFTETAVVDIKPDGDGFIVDVKDPRERYQFRAAMVINAAGLYGDKIAKMVNPKFPYEITALRGEYMKFNCRTRPEVAMNGTHVYPVPQPIPRMFDEKGNPKTMAGTHLTPTFETGPDGKARVGSTVIVGPLAQIVKDKADYANGRKGPEAFLADVTKMFPTLKLEDLEMDFAGIQVKINGRDDYIIERDVKYPNLVHVICDSPGMSHSLDISRYLVDEVLQEGIIRSRQEERDCVAA